jgi:hypothetical protein
MAEVTGVIGNEYVELNNAATEATLKALLLATAGSDDKMRQLMEAAGKAGLDSKSILAANEAVKAQTKSSKDLATAQAEYEEQVKNSATLTVDRLTTLNNSILSLMDGTMQASGAFALLTSNLKGPWALLAAGATKLIAIQEENFATYQKLATSGVNFAGNLTQMRMAAADSYLTLDQFSKVMKENSEAFAKMGGTANDGAIAFSKVNKELIQGSAGQQLMALGYTAEDVSSGLANYIAMTGGRNAQEMKDTKALSAGAAEYLTQLDDLAQITGKSKEQQEAALKEANANQAYQSYLLTLDEEGKKKANTAMAEAMAKGGKGAADALQSQLLGLPPMTKAAQEFTAIAPRMAAANNKMAAAVNDASKGVSDVRKAGDELGVAANQTKQDLGETGKALIMGGGTFSGTIGAIFGTANRNAQQGVKNLEDAENQRKTIDAVRKQREQSQASDMATAFSGFKELGAELWDVFSPLLSVVTIVANVLGRAASIIASVIKGFNSIFEGINSKFEGLGTVIKGLMVVYIAYTAAKKLADAQELIKAKAGEIIKNRGLTAGAPLYTTEVGTGAAGNRATPPTTGTADNRNAPPTNNKGKLGKIGGMGKLAGGVGGIIGGAALDLASEKLKESGHNKLAATADIGSSALTGAGMGALLGPIGAAVGGVLGAGYGLYKNMNTEEPGKDKPKMADGGIVTKATAITAGESGPEAIIPLAKFENLSAELQTLNTTMREMLRYMRDTADNTKKTHDATKSLNGNMFAV